MSLATEAMSPIIKSDNDICVKSDHLSESGYVMDDESSAVISSTSLASVMINLMNESSSCDEMTEESSIQIPDVPNNTPVTLTDLSSSMIDTSASSRVEMSYNYAIGDVMSQRSQRSYTPSLASRQTHNEKERRRRSRMKFSCDMLRAMVPGINEKTDKATVLEHSVNYLMFLQRCVDASKCHANDYVPPPIAPRSFDSYSGNELQPIQLHFQHYDTQMRETDNRLEHYDMIQNGIEHHHIEEAQVMEVHESQIVTASDGMQYMVIETPMSSTEHYQPQDNAQKEYAVNISAVTPLEQFQYTQIDDQQQKSSQMDYENALTQELTRDDDGDGIDHPDSQQLPVIHVHVFKTPDDTANVEYSSAAGDGLMTETIASHIEIKQELVHDHKQLDCYDDDKENGDMNVNIPKKSVKKVAKHGAQESSDTPAIKRNTRSTVRRYGNKRTVFKPKFK